MNCPYCGNDNDRVVDTRPSDEGAAIRRRRHCNSCGQRYTTYERVEKSQLRVVKKNGSRVPFQRERIRQGLEKACWKRPVKESDLDRIVAEVESHLEAHFDSEVPSQYLGELVMDHLRQLDQVAYIRFASVYRRFEDAHDFAAEVRPLLSDKRSPTR